MAFKMNGWNAGHGTGSHSALKKAAKPKPYRKEERVYGGDKTWSEGEAKAESLGQDLNKLVAQRNKLTKGSPEYNKVLDKINMILGSKKRHAGGKGDEASSATTTKTAGVEKTKTISKVDTDGDGEPDEKGKHVISYYPDGTPKKAKIVEINPENGKKYKRMVKYNPDGSIKKERGYGEAPEGTDEELKS